MGLSQAHVILLLTTAAVFAAAMPARASTRAFPVCDFDRGLCNWQANDAGKAEGRTKQAELVSVALSDAAHSGLHSLQIDFRPGSGWANAWLDITRQCAGWADARVDELSFWAKGDGSGKQIRVGIQQWADDLTKPIIFEVPVSLDNTKWHRVVVPLADLQRSNPAYPLRVPSLISIQFDGSGEIGPARLWVDDVEVAAARGEGARFAVGPLDEQIARHPAVTRLPRLGNWGYPGRDQSTLRKCLALGIGFSSTNETKLVQQRNFLAGIATNYSVGRPSGADLIAGLGLTDEDMDQDSNGHRMAEGIESSVFHEAIPGRFSDYVRNQVRPYANAPWVTSFVLSSPISMYGEAHYAASTAGQYAVFSRPAKANFRHWLQRAYDNDLSSLSRAWGVSVASWDDVVPPEGPTAGPEGIDTRQSWSDFMHWYNWWLDEITWRSIQAARRETTKPIAAMLGGPKVGFSQGIALGNIGPVARMLGRARPAFFNDTDSQTLFSARYTSAACSQYGIELMLEHVGPPGLQIFHQYNMVLNVLSCGADHAHLAHLGQLFDPGHWFSRVWTNLAPIILRYRTHYMKSDAAMFHSYMTSWYRPNRSNSDTVSLYDSTNTLWTPDKGYPSWGRALASPDVVDDAMIEDGALKGRKLLVIPNSSVTVTSRKAVTAIRKWVEQGGTLIGFGRGCLAYTVESDRSLKPTPGMAGLIPTALIDQAEAKPGESRVEQKVGKGRVVLYLKPADPELIGPSGKRFVEEMMPVLEDEADRVGVRRWCEADSKHEANLLYCGKDDNSGRHLFTLDLTRYVRNGLPDAIFQTDRTFELTFDPSLTGEAELVAITDSFERCEGGSAVFDPKAHTLILRFRLPGKLKLVFGKPAGGLTAGRASSADLAGSGPGAHAFGRLRPEADARRGHGHAGRRPSAA